MFSEPVSSLIGRQPAVTASPRTSVQKAVEMMARRGVGAVMVVERQRLVGIFSERDAVFRVVACGREPRQTRLAEVMTPAPVTVEPGRSFGHAMALMHEHGCRHMPVVENGRPIGIVSARNALDPELEEFVYEQHRRQRFGQG